MSISGMGYKIFVGISFKGFDIKLFGNAHADNAFHIFAVRVKKSFWNFDVRTVLNVTARPWVVVAALVSRTRFSRVGIISETSLET